jgi:hypothetical protein
MTGNQLFNLALELVLRQLPILVVVGLGLWFALRKRHVLGRASTWAAWGFALLIVISIAGGIVRVLLTIVQSSTRIQSGNGGSVDLTATILWSLVTYLLYLVGLALLTRAIFIDRHHVVSAADEVPG